MKRRHFLSAAGAALSAPAADKPARVGVIGTGGRGTGLLSILLSIPGVEVLALCDVDKERLARARDKVASAGRPVPEGYARGDDDYKRLLERDDLDAVIIATPWELHAPMAAAAMRAGKYAAVEVPAALSVEECWELVKTHEQTGVPCMMLENWSFRRDNLAVLNMIRAGLFGEIIHCHCAHSHNCVYWYFDKDGNPRWPARHLMRRNADPYPTHSLGPVLSWMDINCGDAFAYLTSTGNRSLGLNRQLAKKHGPSHPMARQKFLQSDVVTTVVKTQRGNTLVINNDMQTPRPYDNRWEIQGTEGLYNEQRGAVYIEGRSPQHEQWEPFAPYQEKYDHAWYRVLSEEKQKFGHGGPDYLELQEFVRAVRNRTQTPIDVYDSVTMSVIIPLSEQSMARGSAPVSCPDFTRGKWKTRKPAFATEA